MNSRRVRDFVCGAVTAFLLVGLAVGGWWAVGRRTGGTPGSGIATGTAADPTRAAAGPIGSPTAVENDSALRLRVLDAAGATVGERPIPMKAVRVFACEDLVLDAAVGNRQIAIEYERSGVLFDRESGRVVRKFTTADGWPERRPAEFPPRGRGWPGRGLIGPGLATTSCGPLRDSGKHAVVAEARFAGRTWRALQPAQLLRNDRFHREIGTWTDVLRAFDRLSVLESERAGGGQPARFTTEQGLAGNIVTHLAATPEALWCACAETGDEAVGSNGPGGLCRFDQATGRWQRVPEVAGCPVRWVSLLQAIGDELWVGFREGQGITGDRVFIGMGIHPDILRPRTFRLVLARLKAGKWRIFSRAPVDDTVGQAGWWRPSEDEPQPPTEKPWKLARHGDAVVLFSLKSSMHRVSNSWDVQQDGHVSVLDLGTAKWRQLGPDQAERAARMYDMVHQNGETLLLDHWGAHRWNPRTETWSLLDPGSDLRNPAIAAMSPCGDEMWVGYTDRSYDEPGDQGISRFDEEALRWMHMYSFRLGTLAPVAAFDRGPHEEMWVRFGHRKPNFIGIGIIEFGGFGGRSPEVGCYRDGVWSFPAEGAPALLLLESTPIADGQRPISDSAFYESGLRYRMPGEDLTLTKERECWVEFPLRDRTRAAVGPVREGGSRAMCSKRATWIASWGELIRLDDAVLHELANQVSGAVMGDR